MPGSTILKGQSRKALVNTTLDVVGSAGTPIGVYDTGGYARLTGLLSVVGSATFRVEQGVNSGSFQVSSAFTVNSGGSSFDVVNLGNHTRLSLSQAASQSGIVVAVYGQPLR